MSATTRPPAAYGPIQMGGRLGLATWQVERGLADGIIPRPDVRSRWSAAVVDELADRLDSIREQIGSVPDLGAYRASKILSERLGREVHSSTLIELARLGHVPMVGDYQGAALYDGRALERFDDVAVLDRAIVEGRLVTRDQAAEHMQIRRVDLDHLIRVGRLHAATWVLSGRQRRREEPHVMLLRVGDLDAQLGDSGIDWAAVRETPAGQPSLLARLRASAGDRVDTGATIGGGDDEQR